MLEWVLIMRYVRSIRLSIFVIISNMHAMSCRIHNLQNVTWAAQKPFERRSPSVEDVITQELETGGGACIHQNYFLKLLLDHLGFNTFVVAAEVPSPYLPVPRNHVVTIVRLQNGKEEKLYLIDTGFGRPIPEPINLSELPFSGRAGGFNFEYRFNTELQRYERIALDGCAIKGAFVRWSLYYTIKYCVK